MTTLGTGSGDIELEQNGPGDVKAETGSGNIQLHGLNGALKASTGSGDIEVAGQPTSDWKVSTGSGSVRLTVGNSHFNFDAETGSGSINVSQPIPIDVDDTTSVEDPLGCPICKLGRLVVIEILGPETRAVQDTS